MNGINQSVSSMQKNKDPYSVTSSITEDGLETKKVTGDRSGEDFMEPGERDMGKEEFLMLLTEELKYQDPLDPMDNKDFVTQLAQFSELEAFNSVKSSMDSMNESFQGTLDLQNTTAQSMSNASAVSLVGKEVRIMQDSFTTSGAEPKNFHVQMGGRNEVTVEIRNQEDELVDTVKVNNKDATNAGHFTWDGIDREGNPAGPGKYKLSVAEAQGGSSLYCFVENTVEGLRYSGDDGALLKVENHELPVSNILEVNPEQSGTEGTSGFESLTMGQALTLVGKEIKTEIDPVYKPSVGNIDTTYAVDLNGAESARLSVKDSTGKVILTRDVTESGDVTLPLTGNPDEKYSLSLSSQSADRPYFFMESEVKGVKSTNKGIQLSAGGRLVELKDIVGLSS
ncbi:MAG: flagellar hook capping FlgD N-terminal domain-containing protein [Fibrobacterota bacterium]